MSRLLYIHGEGRMLRDDEGNYYTSGSYYKSVWSRYIELCDELTVIMRFNGLECSKADAEKKYNPIPSEITCIPVVDLYKPRKNYFNHNYRQSVTDTIEKAICKADKVIIRSLCDYYADEVIRICNKYEKKYLVEIISFEFEQLWHHSFAGKIIAPINEIKYRKQMKNVPYAVYVTEHRLQKRYPTYGKMLGCSDVDIFDHDEKILSDRLSHIRTEHTFVIGTAAFLDINYKKQENVVKALAIAREKGFTNFEYQLVGKGNGKRILQIAKKYNLLGNIRIMGEIPHDEVYGWLDKVDLYIQPSYVEGLSRAMIEAMSRACPMLSADVGGNQELIAGKYLYKKTDYKELADLILNMADKEMQCEAAIGNFESAGKYTRENLDKKRSAFYHEFMYG